MESAGELNDTVLVFNKGSNTTGTGVLQTKFSCKDQDQENDSEKDDVSIHKYQCSECDQSFTDGLRLISHLEQHGREDQERRSDIYRCHVCSKVFAQAGILQRHVKMQHQEKMDNICEICFKNFRFPSDLDIHRSCHDPNRPFVCNNCKMRFWTAKALTVHHRMVHLHSPHRCTKCHLSFTRSTELAEHMVTHRDENFPCDLCDETFSCKTSRAEHRKMHTEQEEDLPPLIPPKPPQTMQVTPAISSNVEQYKYRCGICQVRFPDPEQLSEHGCNPAKERPYSCPECNKHFLHGSHLKKHQLSHQLSGPRSYQCNHCSMSFTHHHLFLTHLRKTVKRDKIYQCPICPESFYQALDLANHLSVHSHMCSVSNDLAKHKRKHAEHQNLSEDNREYRCDMCYKSFTMFAHLQKHQETHVGQVVYECTECDKAFAFLNLLEEHQRTHGAASTESLQSQSTIHFPYQSSVNEGRSNY
uniref:C2H2-type domain-containing protein n=1 Tax=Cyprinus carpio TaxID=7962 RepID=A0A8C1RZG7_CYPCA